MTMLAITKKLMKLHDMKPSVMVRNILVVDIDKYPDEPEVGVNEVQLM